MDHEEIIALRELFEEKMKGLEEKIKSQGDYTALRFDSLDTALNLAREDAKDKYEHLNALRNEVTTDRGLLVRRDGCKQTHDGVNKEFIDIKKEIGILREAKSQTEGRAVEKVERREQSNWSVGLIVVALFAAASMIINIIQMVRH